MKRIAICIDDYGLHPAVDDAILSLVDKGRVTATSCMVGAPAWRDDAARLKGRFDAGRVDAGLHLDLTEYPADAGLRGSVRGWMARSVLGAIPTARLRKEIAVQLDRFEAAMHRLPAHVDGHEHVFQFPGVRDLLVEELLRRYPADALPWLRRTRGAGRSGLKGKIIEAMGAGPTERLARAFGFPQNRELLGVYDFRGGPGRYRALLEQWLRAAREGDLLMGHVADGWVPGDGIARARVDEYEVLSADQFETLLKAADVALARMGTLVREQGAVGGGHRGAS